MKKRRFIQLPFIILIAITFLFSCFPEPSTPPITGSENPAVSEISNQIQYNPHDPELYLSRATLYYEMEYYDEAIKDMKKAMSYDSSSIAYRHVLSDIYFDGDKNNEAIGLLEETISIFPASERTILKLSEFQFILNLNEAALQTIDKLMVQKPKHIEGFYMNGRIYRQMGKDAKSIENYKKALEQNDKHFDSLLELGTLYSQNKNKKALQYLEAAKKLSSSNPDPVFEIGNFYRFQGNDKKALEYFNQVTLMDNQYTDAHINSGLIMLDAKDYKKANQYFNIAVETDPTYPSAYYYRGISYASLGDKFKAKQDFQDALNLAPSYDEAKEALLKLE